MFKAIRRLPKRFLALGALSVLAAAIAVPTAFAAPAQSNATCTATDPTALLACIKQFGGARITERLNALDKFNTKVGGQPSKGHISSDLATRLQNDVSTNESGLKALQAKLDAETDVKAAREDVHNIYWRFRIFAVVLPRDTNTLWFALLTNADQRMRGVQDKTQDAISKAPASEQAQLNQLFSDYKAQLQEAEAQIDAGQGQLDVLTVNNFNNDRTTYESAINAIKNDARTAHRDIKQAASDLHQIVKILKANKSGSSSTTPATATATTTATAAS